jgi:hypothetical protein
MQWEDKGSICGICFVGLIWSNLPRAVAASCSWDGWQGRKILVCGDAPARIETVLPPSQLPHSCHDRARMMMMMMMMGRVQDGGEEEVVDDPSSLVQYIHP